MMTLDQIVNALSDRNWVRVALHSKVGYQTVRAIANGTETNPKYQTIKALSEYLERK